MPAPREFVAHSPFFRNLFSRAGTSWPRHKAAVEIGQTKSLHLRESNDGDRQMNPDRRSLLKMLPVAASAALAGPTLLAEPQAGTVTLKIEPSAGTPFRPLQRVTLQVVGKGWENGNIVLLDGAGREYLREKAQSALQFAIGGALGRQTARLLDEHGAIAAELPFMVDCSTRLNDEGGVYRALMNAVLWTMASWNQDNPVSTIHHNDRIYQFFANWIFDHTLILKGMKYFWPDLKDAVDFFADTQCEDGMIWENCYHETPGYNYFDWKFHYDGFVRRIDAGNCSCAAPRWRVTSSSISSRPSMPPGRPPATRPG
jgi:hypothetical protein